MEPWLRFSHGQNGDGVHILCAALGVWVKVTHRVQLVTEEFRTNRLLYSRGEYIQNAASHGKLTGALYHTAAAVTGLGQLCQERIQRIFLANLQGKCRLV